MTVALELPEQPEWALNAACRDLTGALADTFFPKSEDDDESLAIARSYCVTCPSKTQCLDYALRNRIDHGIWGGVNRKGRNAILRRRRIERNQLRDQQEGEAS